MFDSYNIRCNNKISRVFPVNLMLFLLPYLLCVLSCSIVIAQNVNNDLNPNLSPDHSRPKYETLSNVEDPYHSHGHGIGEQLDEEHLKQHNKDEFIDFSKMSQGEIAMHHFRQFDLDNNGRVDGLEVLKKIQKDAREDGNKNLEISDTLINIVDNAMDQYDENSDGYIYYAEFYKVFKKL